MKSLMVKFIFIVTSSSFYGGLIQAQTPDSVIYRQDTVSVGWIRQLKNIILVSPEKETAKDTFNVEDSKTRYLEMEGRRISKIRVIRFKPFGTRIEAPEIEAHPDMSFLDKVGNALHTRTREFIIRNALYFREGDYVDAELIADSERYLRSLTYIHDARIQVVQTGDREVEVIVLTQDVFPYSVDVSADFKSQADVTMGSRNLVGIGLNLQVSAYYNKYKPDKWGYQVVASLPNIAHSHIALSVVNRQRFNSRKTGFVANREFHTPNIKYGGNLTLYNEQLEMHYINRDTSIVVNNPLVIGFRHSDGWLGRSFRLGRSIDDFHNLTLAVRGQQTYFLKRPTNSQNYYYQFQNRNVGLFSINYSRQKYYKTNLIYNYGRTEDIPYGYLFSAVVGKEFNELYNRPYFGASTSGGGFIPLFGYFSGELSYGTFFRNHKTEQGSLNVATDYFTNLMLTGLVRHRFFVSSQFSVQLNNRMNDYLNIDGDDGIPGFRNDSVLGQRRLNLSLEYDLFTPWDFYGFRMVWYAFSHFSWLGDSNRRPFLESTFYTAFGFGIRIRNDRLIINTLQIQFAYFPNIPSHSRFRYFEFSKESVHKHRNFSVKAPEVMSLY